MRVITISRLVEKLKERDMEGMISVKEVKKIIDEYGDEYELEEGDIYRREKVYKIKK